MKQSVGNISRIRNTSVYECTGALEKYFIYNSLFVIYCSQSLVYGQSVVAV